MKRIKLISLVVSLSVPFIIVSCSSSGDNAAPVSTSNITTTTNHSELLIENNKLKNENEQLVSENYSLKSRNEYLEKVLKESSISPLLNNYTADLLLHKIFTENGKVDIFPGRLKGIRVEDIGEETYFIFTIDKMAVNPKWDGPGSDSGKGYFINSEEKYEEYKGGLSTIFSYQGYENTIQKREAILNDSNYKNDRIYNFYMIGDEIVFVGPDPGP
ncbi:hypothetical protein EHE19_007820 [Ruminiclostridium herbifermentans]|uniref:Lipoprotein n=1 Tax=Ruminiclostridium herbifermentans TaxID=2488810 RepID=A0A4U7JJP4_9FIRM|nr:hypothetical protein [Ruminiclostridium herbifermentans]QNU68302.1 hypothetical protein EHE19_007820 [Ruminiclostridium herbifermentans]